MTGLTTPREEILIYLFLRAPHWSEDWKCIEVVRNHGHQFDHIQSALRDLIDSGAVEERESSVKFHGKRVFFIRERKLP